MKLILSIPFSVILYKAIGGQISLNDFSPKRIIEFVLSGEFLIPIIFFAASIGISYVFFEWLIYGIELMFVPLLKKMLNYIRVSQNTVNKHKTQILQSNPSNWVKNIIIRKKHIPDRIYDVDKAEKNLNLNNSIICMILQFLLTLRFALGNEYILSTLVNSVLTSLAIVAVFYFVLTGAILMVAKNYPLTFSKYMQRTHEPNPNQQQVS